jgi:hypothetical protein
LSSPFHLTQSLARFLLFRSAKIKTKTEVNQMAEKEENKKRFSTCLEGIPFAEMMQKMIGQQGIGSLCTEMMKKVMAKQGDDRSLLCAEMMGSMMKGCCGIKEESKETKQEEGHGCDK